VTRVSELPRLRVRRPAVQLEVRDTEVVSAATVNVDLHHPEGAEALVADRVVDGKVTAPGTD